MMAVVIMVGNRGGERGEQFSSYHPLVGHGGLITDSSGSD